MKLKNFILLLTILLLVLFSFLLISNYFKAPRLDKNTINEISKYKPKELVVSYGYGITVKQEELKFEQTIEEPKIFETSFLLFGDMMLTRSVESLSIAYGDNNYPFLNVKDLLNTPHDFTFGNLEGPIDKNHVKTKNGSVSFSFPKYSGELLKNNNFNLLQLSNNHMQDRGTYGFLNTQEELKKVDIDFFGDYYNTDEYLSFEKEINNQKFLFIGINMITSVCEKDIEACIENINSKIQDKLKDKNDYFSILFIHWGNEYKLKSNVIQQELAHKVIASGIDLIVGGHPHVTQEIEKYNGKIIFYSLGNFVFDQYFSKDTQQGMAIEFKLFTKELSNTKNLEFNIIPLQGIKSQSEIMDAEKEKIFLDTMIKNSSPELKDEILNKKIMGEIKD